jgi:hypothetical protein
MGILRSYFAKNTTLIRDNLTNNSRNPIIEFSYGNSLNSSSTAISRYIFQVDLSNLLEKLSTQELLQQNIVSHKVKIKNVIAESQDLIGQTFMDAYRGSNTALIIYPLNEDFSEGTGFDFIYNPTAYNQDFLNETPANWYYRDSNIPWAESGTFSSLTPSDVLSIQYLQDGSEDLELDVTDYINSILFSGGTHYGLGIAYSSTTESFTSNNRYVITFFSKYTQTYYEPFLETEFNQTINENRCFFPLDEDNYLYLISNTNLTSVDSVEIYDYEDNLYTTIPASGITLVKKNIWAINLNISSTDYPDIVNFTDKWFCTVNGKQYTHDQEFTLFKKDYFTSRSKEIAEYYFNFFGIVYNEKITRASGSRKIYIQGKRLFNSSVDNDLHFDSLEYRIYNQQSDTIQLDVVPWTAVNKIDGGLYFDLDPSWLIPQFYFIELRVNINGYKICQNNRIKFNIVSE